MRRVVEVRPAGRLPEVYCLTVDSDVPAFALANGVVVHNCADEVRYRCLEVRMPRAEARARIQNIGSFIAARKRGW